MLYRNLGDSGLQVSLLSFGSWVTFSYQVGQEEANNLMKIAYESGINFFDNAEVYAKGEAEIIMGNSLKQLNFPRDSYCVSSKVFFGGELPTQRGLSRKHIYDACHGALKRMKLDYLDMFFCHRPDYDTPIKETVWAMNDLIKQGKVMYWGTSEWNAQQITEAFQVADKYNLIPPTMEQPEYNLFKRHRVEVEYRELYKNFGLGTTIWSPLASGLLTGKYGKKIPPESRLNVPGYEWLKEDFYANDSEKIKKVDALKDISKELNCSMACLAIAWCAANQNVSSVILGASNENQLKENIKSLDIIDKLDQDILDRIDNIVDNKPVVPRKY